MKALKTLGFVLLGAIVAVLIIGLFLPSAIRVESKLVIRGDPARLHDAIATPRVWKQWSLWNDANFPELEHSYRGPESGVDAEHRWKSRARSGYLKVTASDPKTGVSLDLGLDERGPPWKVTFTYAEVADASTAGAAAGDGAANPEAVSAPAGGGEESGDAGQAPVPEEKDIEVTWTLSGEASGLTMKYVLALFKPRLEEQLDESLRGLSELVARQAHPTPAVGG